MPSPAHRHWSTLSAAPHRIMFLSGMTSLLAASAWWTLHLCARYLGTPAFGFRVTIAPIWAHAFPLLFTTLPAFIFGFLFTTFPRWMDGPPVPRSAYVPTAVALAGATLIWLAGVHADSRLCLLAVGLAALGLATGLAALLRVLVESQKTVAHAVVASIAISVALVAVTGFGWGLARADGAALHFAVRTALWGFLLPLFFAVCHRMVPFFSQGVIVGYVAWRPLWVLVAVVALSYARLLAGTLGWFDVLPWIDLAMLAATALCAWRWSSRKALGTPLLWTLYAGVAWLPVAMALQTVRDAGYTFGGEWLLGRAPVHALTMGFFASMLVAMVSRVTVGHSGRPLIMDRITLAAFVAIQFAALARLGSELVRAPAPVAAAMLAAALLWLLAVAAWTSQLAPICLAARSDGRPG